MGNLYNIDIFYKYALWLSEVDVSGQPVLLQPIFLCHNTLRPEVNYMTQLMPML
jgi:hypothetical protein